MSQATLDVAAWATIALDDLIALQGSDGAWPYHAGQSTAVEPTALAALATGTWRPGDPAVEQAVAWLLDGQREDGLFSASPLPDSTWVTPLPALALLQRGEPIAADAAAEALLAMDVFTFPQLLVRLYGYDTTIPGWAWTDGGFSFIEPTALAVTFLKRAGRGDAARVRRAADLLRDRALPGGGWNYGEPEVLDGKLFPAVVPTAMSLVALADEQDAATDAALSWLLDQRGNLSSLLSLGWATIALHLLGALDDDWLARVLAKWLELPQARRGPLETSLCLLGLASPEGHPFSLE